MIEIDHIFCFVDPAGDWAERATSAGYVLDAGIAHPGQGTRNRRLWLAEQYVEFLWIESPADAAANPLRLDQRRCPFGIGLRGQLDDEFRAACSPYRPPYAPDVTIWIYRADPEQPFVFAFDTAPGTRGRRSGPQINPGVLRSIELSLPVTPQPVLNSLMTITAGPPRLVLHIDGNVAVQLTDELVLRTP